MLEGLEVLREEASLGRRTKGRIGALEWKYSKDTELKQILNDVREFITTQIENEKDREAVKNYLTGIRISKLERKADKRARKAIKKLLRQLLRSRDEQNGAIGELYWILHDILVEFKFFRDC